MHRLLGLLALPLLYPLTAVGQVNTGELRLSVTDQDGLAVRASIELLSQGNQFRSAFVTDEAGKAQIQTLPYGLYLLTARKPGFAETSTSVEVRSALPTECKIKLQVAGVYATIRVNAASTLIDPDRPSSIMQMGTRQIEDRVQSLPGRSVQDLVITQPGWIYEGNSVLHPRGSEYQTQFVVDGMPLTDNRSPSFGPEIEADDLESMSIYTAGFPAEFGRKMGGVIELNTKRNPNPGLHGQVVLSGGSYDTAQGYARVQDTWGKNTIGASASGGMTSHYLNPVVPENYTNDGTTGDFSLKYEGDFTERDRLILGVRHELSRFEIPNELIQQEAGQLQNGNNFETLGTVTYAHIFSTDMLGSVNGMVRDNANNLKSNELSTPVIATQNNAFLEGYFKAALSFHHRNQEWKMGGESDNSFLNEDFSYVITNPDDFDDGTPPELTFAQSRPDLEQSAFFEDLIRLGQWTVRAGLRWDHYQLLLNEHALSPRLSLGRYFPSAKMVVHASYDRIFQTPSFENILISSSSEVTSLNPEVLRLPVAPSKGNYYEGGVSKAFADRVRLDINAYRRNVTNFADDDQLLNTGVSYPIAFDKAIIYGAEGKLDVVRLGKLTGYVSYSYMVGNVWYPVTGGLFLGDDVTDALSQTSGHFPNSQDQRNTVQTRFQYQWIRRMWMAGGLSYGSGLPFQYGGTYEDALAQYGPEVVSRINFDRGRVKPSLALNASICVDVHKSERLNMRLQVDGDNLNGRLNVIDFGGLFSGNAIGPGRSFGLRLNSSF